MSKAVGRGELRGNADAILAVSAFGFVWAAAVPDSSLFILAVSVVVSLALILVALYLRRASRIRPETPWNATLSTMMRRFRLVALVEGLAIGAAVFVLVRLGSPEWIPAVVALIVGLHFFPLASIFRFRLYYVSGALLCAVFALTLILTLGLGVQAAWFIVPRLGCALVLWATGAVLAVLGIRRSRAAGLE